MQIYNAWNLCIAELIWLANRLIFIVVHVAVAVAIVIVVMPANRMEKVGYTSHTSLVNLLNGEKVLQGVLLYLLVDVGLLRREHFIDQ